MKRVNYLNNRDLLAEIHKSKNTYCSYVSESDHQYDVIVTDIKKINTASIAQARKTRAKRLTQGAWEQAKATGNRRLKLADYEISPRKIDKTDVVFRVMTFDHIPLDPERKRSPKSRADHHARVNFPPFQHYRLNSKGEPVCVGKSHWVGGMDNGHYSGEHGKITNNLALMYMKLCERYGTRSNWRGYTYNDEMQSQALMQLSQIGLQFDESKSDNPFAYYTAAITNSFTRILNIEKKNQNIRDDIMEMEGMMPSHTRQMKNETDAHNSAESYYRRSAKKQNRTYKSGNEPAPVTVYSKKAIKELNKKLKAGQKLTADDFDEVK